VSYNRADRWPLAAIAMVHGKSMAPIGTDLYLNPRRLASRTALGGAMMSLCLNTSLLTLPKCFAALLQVDESVKFPCANWISGGDNT